MLKYIALYDLLSSLSGFFSIYRNEFYVFLFSVTLDDVADLFRGREFTDIERD